jgi:sec-independent protein translocase protein TatA
MGLTDLFEGPHLVILILVIVVLFGWKRLPDAARGLGRSMRIFKSEMGEMKNDGKATFSAASSDTIKGETAHPTSDPIADPTRKPASDPGDKHDQASA